VGDFNTDIFNENIMAEQTEEKVQEELKPKGRAAALAEYRAANPDLQDEPDDDTLHDFRNGRYSELEGQYNELNGANTRLAELVSKDPRLAAVLSMVAGENPKSFPYAVANVYGKEPFDLEGDALEEFEAGYQESLKRLSESEKARETALKNLGEYETTLNGYVKEKGLTDEQLAEIHNGIMTLADNLLMGVIPVELIDLVYKGMNYEKDVQEAADTGFVEGKNNVIDAKLKKPDTRTVPDLGNGTGAGKNIPRPARGGLGSPGEW
jgi:hypothetical protein